MHLLKISYIDFMMEGEVRRRRRWWEENGSYEIMREGRRRVCISVRHRGEKVIVKNVPYPVLVPMGCTIGL